MKKIAFALLAVSLIILSSCAPKADVIERYSNLGDFKGVEFYAWKEGGEVFCGLMPGTNRLKTPEEIEALKEYPADVGEMKAILSSYDTDYIFFMGSDGLTDEEAADLAKELGTFDAGE